MDEDDVDDGCGLVGDVELFLLGGRCFVDEVPELARGRLSRLLSCVVVVVSSSKMGGRDGGDGIGSGVGGVGAKLSAC